MELVQVKGNTWYLKGAQLIPLYKVDGHRCILLDSGWPREREELAAALKKAGLIPIGVIGTHTHIDHSGNYNWLKETFGAKICTSIGEAATAVSPIVAKWQYEGMSMKGIDRLMEGLVFSPDQILSREDGTVEFMGIPFRIHHTPGHSMDHFCVGTPDGVCYVSDLVLAGEVIQSAQLPYHYVHAEARESMEKMRDVEGYSAYIAAHYEVVEDLSATIDENIALLDRLCERMLGQMAEPITWDRLMMGVVELGGLMKDGSVMRAVSYERAVQGFVDYLEDTGKIRVFVERGIRHFQRLP